MEQNELKLLIRKRASVKSRLTHFSNFINKLNLNRGDLASNKIELEQRLQRVQQALEDFDDLQCQIEAVSEDCDLDSAVESRETFESNFYRAIALAHELLNCAASDQSAVSAQIGQNIDNYYNSAGVKLPTIQLPKFEGLSDTWLEFRDTFKSLIHDNHQIGDIQKFHYLRASLSSGAAETIKAIEFTEANYRVAWDLICDRYNNKRLLINTHVKGLFELPLIKESSSQLRNLSDTIKKHLRALKQLDEPTEHWDTMVIYLINSKFDKITQREWEIFKGQKDVPSLDDLYSFLKNRADFLEVIADNSKANQQKPKQVFAAITNSCVFCQGDHFIYQCEGFKGLSIGERGQRARRLKLCLNCLQGGHFARECAKGSCKKCSQRHNTLLHGSNSIETQNSSTSVTLACNMSTKQNLLATAKVKLENERGRSESVRCLLDSGSQSSFITSRLCHRFGLAKRRVNISISALSGIESKIEECCQIILRSAIHDYKIKIDCYVLDQITGQLPNESFQKIEIPSGCRLADPEYNVSNSVDMLIGADLFWDLLLPGKKSIGIGKPILYETKLGWVVSGPINSHSHKIRSNLCAVNCQLQKFWELEEVSQEKPRAAEEIACETHYVNNTSRAEDGRFVVSIPFKDSLDKLGNSRERAEQRFYKLERKLQRNSDCQKRYIQFMREYCALGHMSKVESENDSMNYYMPHHGVVKEESTTTKLRVVFDASAPTSTGKSLNDLQMTGPIIQSDLTTLLLRFRTHKYALTADIEKMYRQVLIKPEQRCLQRILWRETPDEMLNTYQLNTVTYGTTAASFLAIRSIFELGCQIKELYPKVAEVIQRDFYVDDLISGADTIEDARVLCAKLSEVLSGGCFNLRKWRSNRVECLEGIAEPDSSTLNFEEGGSSKTLGVAWSCTDDCFKFHINIGSGNNETKRSLLSKIAQIFDPLGLLAPCVIPAKLLMQQLWLKGLDWDEEIPQELAASWAIFCKQLSSLNELSIPRRVICSDSKVIELHAFSDASISAYGTCVYVRSINKNGDIFSNLFISKSKVAPLKSITIPRLELCGALLASRLLNKINQSLRLPASKCFCWTDSTIVLGWIRTSPNLLKTFVDTRVAEIQDLTHTYLWRHVPTKQNPADLASRGLEPSVLSSSRLWWHGPDWLCSNEDQWPENVQIPSKLPDVRDVKICLISVRREIIVINRFSSLQRLINSFAYVLRFIEACKGYKSWNSVKLSIHERDTAFHHLLRQVQAITFPEDLRALREGKNVSRTSNILGLHPFWDDGLIKVGGRLRHSEVDTENKHPVLLPASNHLTKLIFKSEHIRLMHCGAQLLLATIRTRFWPINGRNLAKQTVRSCVTCARYSPKPTNPIMGDLPGDRVKISAPFSVVGVDYAGPIWLKAKYGRRLSPFKGWICLFICFSTKAVHLEAVTGLSTNDFLLAFNRFVCRRGKPVTVYSDNGTNFRGASRELSELGSFLKDHHPNLKHEFEKEQIQWHFTPSFSPHFGGLWEAGIKSCKHHIKREVGNARLTYEELSTVLSRVEAVLNSRPLSPLSSHPDDLLPLTPGHFLIGRPLTALPEKNIISEGVSGRTRYEHIMGIQQRFWKRWSLEYLSELQNRTKWKDTRSQLKVGDLVVIKEDNCPPMVWRMGRVLELHPGADGVARVATVKCSAGVVRRNFTKLCVLPIEN